MADQHARFEIYLGSDDVLWRGQVTPKKVNLVQNYPTAGGRKGSVVIGINVNDEAWHAQIPGMDLIRGSYDDVADSLASEGIYVPGKENVIEELYGVASQAQFAYNVLSNLKESGSEPCLSLEEARDILPE